MVLLQTLLQEDALQSIHGKADKEEYFVENRAV